MHIAFEQGLQKLGSLVRRKFQVEEIDSYLNRAQEQFISDSIKHKEDEHGFQEVQVDVDRIRTLISKKTILAEFIQDYTDYREYNVVLPSDYSYLISDSWKYAKYCPTTSGSQTLSRFLYVMPLLDSTAGSPPYYADFQLQVTDEDTINDTLVDLDIDYPGYTGYSTISQKFFLPSLLQSTFDRHLRNGDYNFTLYTVYDVHYERFKQYYYPGSFLISVSTDAIYPPLIIDGDTISPLFTKSIPFINHTNTTYKYYTSRLNRASALDNILSTEYYKPILKSPVSTIDKGIFRLFSHISQIVNSVLITYIHQPQKINLTLQVNSELAPEFHKDVVDMAVRYAAGRLEQEKLYQVTALENKLDK